MIAAFGAVYPVIDFPTRIASTAIVASADIDAERSRLYLDLILMSLSEYAAKAFEVTMNSLGYEYQSDFARRYVAQGREEGKAEGKVEGKAEGRAEIVFKQLSLRFGPLNDEVRARILGAQESQIDALAKRLLTAQTLEEALASLS